MYTKLSIGLIFIDDKKFVLKKNIMSAYFRDIDQIIELMY